MDPEVWGPHAWIFLHTITLTYPHNPTDQDKKNYKMFFYNLATVLPCTHCSQNYRIHLKQLPIDIEQSNNNYDISKFIPIFLLSIPIIFILLFIFQKSLKQNFYNTLNTIHNKPISI